MPQLRLPTISLVAMCFTSVLCTGCSQDALMALRDVAEKAGARVVDGSSDDDILEMFRKANRNCPTRMDEYTTLVEVKIVDEQTIEFHYRVTDTGKRLVSRMSPDLVKRKMVDVMKANEMVVAIVDRDLSIHHMYEDRYGGHVLSYMINREVLNGNLNPNGSEKANPFADPAPPTQSNAIAKNGSTKAKKPTVKPSIEIPKVDVSEVRNVSLQPESTPENPLPTQYRTPKSSKQNPAGVAGNPFFQG